MNRITRRLAGGALIAFVLAFCALQQPVRSQQAVAVVTSQTITSTASSGTSDTLGLDGKFSNCVLVASNTTGAGTITVNGNTQSGQYGPGAPNIVNTTFGTSGVVTLTSTPAGSSGNMSSTPVGVFYTWTGNTGTLTSYITCSGTIASVNAGATVANNSTIVAPTSTANGAPGVNVNVLNSPLPNGPVPTASAGAAPPTNTAQMVTLPQCNNLTGTVNVTAGNMYPLRCDSRGNLKVVIGGNGLNQWASLSQGQVNALLTFAGANTETATVTTTACTSITTTQTLLTNILYIPNSNTGVLTIYNEGASPTCTAADTIYTTSAAVTTITYTTWPFLAGTGLAYKWSAAQASTNAAFIGSI